MVSKLSIFAVVTLLPLTMLFLLLWQFKPNNLRLPTHIWPQAYNITFQPFMEEKDAELRYTFLGDVKIRIQSVINTKSIVMHSRNLDYNSIEYWAEHMPLLKQKIKKIRYDFETERMKFELSHELKPIYNYILHFKYNGLIKNESFGVFRNEYKDSVNRTRWIVGTQFQPNEARSAFPCFDEPQFKSTFKISIVRPKHMKSYSNQRLACSYMKDGLFVDNFETTPIMPVYSVVFFIAPYKERSDGTFSVIAKPESFDQTKFSFEQGRKILSVLGEYFNMSYYDMGIAKLSLAALSNINFNGMENWGLVFISQNDLLCNENSTAMAKKQKTSMLLAHELSHMWFGNLVTCDWWTSVWLNEGFATYFSYFSQEMLQSNNSYWKELFFENVIQQSLSIDNGDLPALNAERKSVSRDYFNSVTYTKGAFVIHMIKHIIGDKNFQDCTRKYLQAYKYKTVTLSSLHKILREYWPMDFEAYLEAFLKSFIEQKSYPLITINLSTNSASFEISQEGFSEALKRDEDSLTLFTVPISFTTNLEANFSNTAPNFFLSTKKKSYKLYNNSTIKWLIANIQATGYYRVNYNEQNWLHIGAALQAYNWSGIPLLSRAKIVDDLQNIFCIGKISSQLALKVLNYLSTEVYYLPWKVALKYLTIILRYSELSEQEITILMRKLSNHVYSSLGFEENLADDLSTIKNREQIVALACRYGNLDCLNKVKYYYETSKELRNLPKYLQFVVYCTTIREGNATIYEELFHLYVSKNENEEKKLILKALGCLKDPAVIEKHFWNIMSQSVSKNQKLNALESLYAESNSNAFQVYKLIKLNFKKVLDALGKETIVVDLISEISKYFSANFQKQDFINFSKINKISNKISLEKLQEATKALSVDKKCF